MQKTNEIPVQETWMSSRNWGPASPVSESPGTTAAAQLTLRNEGDFYSCGEMMPGLNAQSVPAIPEFRLSPRIGPDWRPDRLEELFENSAAADADAVALICGEQRLSYGALDARANQLAHLLIDRGIGPGHCVGILLDRSVETYVALLGVLKSGAAFVPIDPSFPADRVAFIAEDAGLRLLLTSSQSARDLGSIGPAILVLDEAGVEIASSPRTRPFLPPAGDSLCYVIYTSGTSGRPKGVAVSHASICNFLHVCVPVYGYVPSDRVYQGMTLAFDFSIEEIWPTFAAGATLIAGPNDHRRLGPCLADFLIEKQVTVMCCVPTLLATLDRDVPSLRLLLVGGEACPQDLVGRWSRSGRRMLNTYGPTETSVTATWTELHPGKSVTIGRPLPTYTVHILDERDDVVRALPPGQTGEICIGGPSVARGYLNRPELTDAKFIADPFDALRPGARLYRTGDLGRITADGEIEYLGRIDAQVKLRGYRIELSEIQAVLLESAELENAIVVKLSHEAGDDLVAYVTLRFASADQQVLKARLHEVLRQRLPIYMVPAFIEFLDAIPMLASGKADRARLPVPRSARLALQTSDHVPAATPLEREIAQVWTSVFGPRELSVEANFFIDLGGHSLFAANVVSRLRKSPSMRHLPVADLYTHPTIRALARRIEETATRPAPATQGTRPVREVRRHGSGRVLQCGAVQTILLYLLLALLGAPAGLVLAAGLHGLALAVAFAAIVPLSGLIMSLLLPIAAKWLLVGRFRAGRYPLWGWYYCRWWLMRKVTAIAPLDLLAGSPLMPIYARMLGAKVGNHVHIGSAALDVPDLIEIGDGASIGYQAELQAYVVEDGFLHMAPIRIGAGAFVGTNAVLLPGACVGAGARVTDQSLVARDQFVPDGQTWSGSPARASTEPQSLLDAMSAAPGATRTGWSAAAWAGFVAGAGIFEFLPLLLSVPGWLLVSWTARRHGFAAALAVGPVAGALFVLLTCASVAAGKRIAMPRARPGIFPLQSALGMRKWFADKLMAISLGANNTIYSTLYVLPWLRLLGARVGRWAEVSTVSHIDPDLLVLGPDSFVADMASVGAATFHHGSVALGPTELGSRCFVGNSALVPIHTRLGNDSLIGVQSVPPTHPVEAGTSWLGSPSIFLPHRQASAVFDETLTYRPPARLVVMRLAIEFLRIILPPTFLYVLALPAALLSMWMARRFCAAALIALLPLVYIAAGLAAVLIVAAMKWVIVGRYRPRVEPHWCHFVWRTELITGLYESVAVPALIEWFAGTPLMPPLLRLFGARFGKRVFIDSTYLTEFDLVSVGDDAAIGDAAALQTHLYEDRVMKMSNVRISAGCTVGARSVVLYDSVMGPGASLDALSLVMKGECLPADSHWRGIPAGAVECG
jgi:non-ribosomal peptide synthetase-like protein